MFKSVNGGKLPTRATKYSACVDVYANEDVVIGAGETKIVGLGIAIDEDALVYGVAANEEFMSSHYLQLMLRSSLGAKGLIIPNGVGIIDMDYRDEIKMIVHNPVIPDSIKTTNFPGFAEVIGRADKRVHINKGDRIGQITLLEHHSYLFDIDTEEERAGGFGSTGGIE